jgi:hypothetical protein
MVTRAAEREKRDRGPRHGVGSRFLARLSLREAHSEIDSCPFDLASIIAGAGDIPGIFRMSGAAMMRFLNSSPPLAAISQRTLG